MEIKDRKYERASLSERSVTTNSSRTSFTSTRSLDCGAVLRQAEALATLGAAGRELGQPTEQILVEVIDIVTYRQPVSLVTEH